MQQPTIEETIMFIIKKFDGLYDKTHTEPMVIHSLKVYESVKNAGKSEIVQLVALLHDVVEDTTVSINDLVQMGYDIEVINAVELLTRRDNVVYFDYIQKLKYNHIARVVKVADILHNVSRLDGLPKDEQKGMLKRYQKAYKMLVE